MTDTSWELLARRCLHDSMRSYPEFEHAYLEDAELRSGADRAVEVLTAVIACMEGEGVDAPTAERIIRSSWQVMIGSTLRAVAKMNAEMRFHDVR